MTTETHLNPFASSRVDNPFQRHSDVIAIYQAEYQRLTALLREIETDANAQTRGAVIIGEPGSGKTHLAMRMATDILSKNRLLFIRQPNHPDAVLYHIYSRMLESLAEPVPGTPFSQIEFLIGKSIARILIQGIRQKEEPGQKDRMLLDLLEADPMNLFKKIGSEGTENKRKNWRYIEGRILDWWQVTHGFSGYGPAVVKGLVRFCSYSNRTKRRQVREWLAGKPLSSEQADSIGLTSWQEDMGLEAFALEAIAVIGKLSLEDRPLVIIFDQLEGLLYHEDLFFRFGDAIKELFTHIPNSLMIFNLFPDRWRDWQNRYDPAVVDRMSQQTIHLTMPDTDARIALLKQRMSGDEPAPAVLPFTQDELDRIISQPSIRAMLNAASDYYRLHTDGIPLPRDYITFEEEVRRELRQLRSDVAALKTYLNMTTPTFQEITGLETLREFWEAELARQTEAYDNAPLLSGNDDVGKLFTLMTSLPNPDRIRTKQLKHGQRKLPAHLLFDFGTEKRVVGFAHSSGRALTARLKNFADLADRKTEMRFLLLRDHRATAVRTRMAKEARDRLLFMDRADYRILNREDRIRFDALYETVVAVQNRDLDVNLSTLLKALSGLCGPHFVFDIFPESAQQAVFSAVPAKNG